MLKIQTKSSGAELTSIQYDGKEILFQGAKVLDNNGNGILGKTSTNIISYSGST